MEQQEDTYYINKVIEGEINYFSNIVERYQEIVFSIALKMLKNKDDAEEVAQESFIKVYNSLSSFKGASKFSTWLYRITYNQCITTLRKKKQHFVSTDDVDIADEEEMNLDGIPAERRAKAIKDAMEELPEEDYTLIMLYYFKDQSVEAICSITGLTESNTKVKLFRARKKLYGILDRNLKEAIYTLL